MLHFGQEQITRLKRIHIRTEGSVRTGVVVSWLHFLLYACLGWLIHCLLFPLVFASRRPHKTLNASLSVGSWAKPKLQGGRLVWGMDNFSSIAFSLLKLPCEMPFWVARKWFYTCIIKRPRFVRGRGKSKEWIQGLALLFHSNRFDLRFSWIITTQRVSNAAFCGLLT